MNIPHTIKKKAALLDPVVRIGKNGICDNTVAEVNKVLNKRGLIKIKFLKSALKEKKAKDLAKLLGEKTNSEVVYTVGFATVLYKNLNNNKTRQQI